MKDLKEIKYKTDIYDEEGNPIYITEAEFREHGIITEEPPAVEPIKVKWEPIKPTVGSVIAGILWFFAILFFTCLIWVPCGVFFALGVAIVPTEPAEGIVICIITGIVIIANFGFAIYTAIVRTHCEKGEPSLSSYKSRNSDGIEGTYVTHSYTRPNGQTVIHISKED